MKRSPSVGFGVYQYEFREDRIDLVQWSEPPTSTLQWVKIHKQGPDSFLDKYKLFYLEGTSNEDIKLVPDEDAFEIWSTSS